MSRLEDLIAKLCPDGVEYIPFSEVCQYIRGVTYNKSQEAKNADIDNHKILRANNITLSTNTLNFDDVKLVSSSVKIKETQYLYQGDILICAGSGSRDHIGKVAYIFENLDYSFGGFMAVIRCSQKLESRYLFHILTSDNFKNYLDVALNSSTINNLSYGIIKNFLIPVPPLEVQREIVRILDGFTELQSELQSELQAELQARKQQYEYYQKQIFLPLNNSEYIVWKKISEICKKTTSGGTPKASNQDYYGGDIPWLRTQEVDWKDITDTKVKITKEGLKNSSAKWIPENCVIIAMYGATAGKVAVNKIPLTTNQACCNLQIDKSEAMYRYVYYWLCREYKNIKAMGQGSQSNINAQMIKNYLIPVPPLEVQQRIVSILDRFDALCNDLTAGIPAEIEARQKQYEYYRDKLLNFKRKQA